MTAKADSADNLVQRGAQCGGDTAGGEPAIFGEGFETCARLHLYFRVKWQSELRSRWDGQKFVRFNAR